jgi:glycosyltransferase involved in cell wall biosynthesis
VLISCFDGAAWLQESISSVLNQTFEDFELILVDDGSADRSLQIMEQAQSTDDRVVLIRKEHSGLTDSLNVGLAAAKGRWIARLDSDDLCEPDRLAEQVSYAERHDVVLVGSGFVEIDVAGNTVKIGRYPGSHSALVRRLIKSRGFFPHSSALFNREAALRAGAYNPRFLKSQDRDLWLRLAETGRLNCISRPLVKVRKHAQSVSNSAVGHSQFVYGTAASACYLLRQAGVDDPSADADGAAWDGFLGWIAENDLTKIALSRRQVWGELRGRYLGQSNRLRGLWVFAFGLVSSGMAMALLREKFFGLSLPARLSANWAKTSCAVSSA